MNNRRARNPPPAPLRPATATAPAPARRRRVVAPSPPTSSSSSSSSSSSASSDGMIWWARPNVATERLGPTVNSSPRGGFWARGSDDSNDDENESNEAVQASNPSVRHAWGGKDYDGDHKRNTSSWRSTSDSYLETPTSGHRSPPPLWDREMPQEAMTLTFGIELEHVFAFRNDAGPEFAWMKVDDEDEEDGDEFDKRWIQEVRSGGGSGSGSPSKRRQSSHSLRPKSTEPQTSDWLVDWRDRTNTHQPTWKVKHLRTMFIQQRILRHAGLDCSVEESDPLAWELKMDLSIRGPHGKGLLEALPDRIRQGEQKKWVSHGHELVSRVLTAPERLGFATFRSSTPLQEIERYVRAMVGNASDPFGAFTNASCGLHVHVARAPTSEGKSERLPLPVLQHLAYLLVQFEELITALHPIDRRCTTETTATTRRRTPGNGNRKTRSAMIGSNLMGLQRSPHICQALPAVDLRTAATKIFSAKMTAKRLGQLMCTAYINWPRHNHWPRRYKFVNFERLIRDQEGLPQPLPLTIEFRQHAGTLDFTEIAHWVHFVLSLVRAAERMAHRSKPASPNSPKSPRTVSKQLEIHLEMPFPRQQGNKYKIRCPRLRDEYDRLFDLLDFDRHTRHYWMERFATYNPEHVRKVEVDGYGVERIVVTEEQCPACQIDEAVDMVGAGDDFDVQMAGAW